MALSELPHRSSYQKCRLANAISYLYSNGGSWGLFPVTHVALVLRRVKEYASTTFPCRYQRAA